MDGRLEKLSLQMYDPPSVSTEAGHNREVFDWNALPMELKVMCVKKMDFVTRMRLSAVSRREEALVRVNRQIWDNVSICFDRMYQKSSCEFLVQVTAGSMSETLKMQTVKEEILEKLSDKTACVEEKELLQKQIIAENQLPYKKLYKRMADILNKSFIDTLTIEVIAQYDANFFIRELKPLRVKNLWARCPYTVIYCILQMNRIPMEKICMADNIFGYRLFDRVLTHPKLTTAKLVEFGDPAQLCIYDFKNLLRLWTKNNAEIGQKLLLIKHRRLMICLADEFKKDNFIIEKNHETLRIRSQNKDKHILVCTSEWHAIVTLIPANLPKYPYGEEYTNWKLVEWKKPDINMF